MLSLSGSIEARGEMIEKMTSLFLGVFHTSIIAKYDYILLLFGRTLTHLPAAP